MSFYLIRLGEGSQYIEEARKEGFIAIGWNQVTNLAPKVGSMNYELRKEENILEDIKKELKAEGASVASVAGQAKQRLRGRRSQATWVATLKCSMRPAIRPSSPGPVRMISCNPSFAASSAMPGPHLRRP